MCHCAVTIETYTSEIASKQLKIEGFAVTRWLKDWPGAIKEMAQWIQEVYLIMTVTPHYMHNCTINYS